MKLIVVLHPDYFDLWQQLFESLPEDERFSHEVVAGGKTRTESVKNGIAAIPAESDSLIAVHDAARPLVSVDMIGRGWEAAVKGGGAVPVVPVTDSLRRLDEKGSTAVDRSGFVAVQTPQVFQSSLLKRAYEMQPDAVFSDDASAYESASGSVLMFDGETDNMKITNPGDIEIASLLLSRKRN